MPYRRLASSPPPISSASTHRHHTLLLAFAVSASTLLLLALLVLLLLLYLYLSRRSPTLPFPSSFSSPASPIHRFSYRSLRAATASFDASRSIGRGASAAVFRGILPDGKSVAVKRLLHSPSPSPSHLATSDREFHNDLIPPPPAPFTAHLLTPPAIRRSPSHAARLLTAVVPAPVRCPIKPRRRAPPTPSFSLYFEAGTLFAGTLARHEAFPCRNARSGRSMSVPTNHGSTQAIWRRWQEGWLQMRQLHEYRQLHEQLPNPGLRADTPNLLELHSSCQIDSSLLTVEIGDFENWMKIMDFDCKTINAAIRNIHQI